MTRDEARRRAVEAAADAAYVSEALVELVMAPYLAAMADAGWRMVRDVDDRGGCDDEYVVGWNACRRAMLEGDGG